MVFRKTLGDRVFDLIIWFFVVAVLIITLYPLIYVISMAISDPYAAARGEVWLFPKGIDFSAMKTVLNDSDLFTYYYNSIWYAVVGTVTGIITTSLAAYPLSRPEFKLRGPIMKFIMFTMFFSGGTIPTYLVVAKHLHLYNNRLALILPVLTSAWYITVARSFFESLPGEIVESARIDGASEYRIFRPARASAVQTYPCSSRIVLFRESVEFLLPRAVISWRKAFAAPGTVCPECCYPEFHYLCNGKCH